MIIAPPDWTGSFLKLIPILSVLKILDLLRHDGPVHNRGCFSILRILDAEVTAELSPFNSMERLNVSKNLIQ